MRYWWVNQNQTYRAEIRGGFMWSPKLRSDGSRNPYYDTMPKVSPGDVVFSFCDTRIKAIGIVSGRAQTGPSRTSVLPEATGLPRAGSCQ
jgi:putative restriction endonuclease